MGSWYKTCGLSQMHITGGDVMVFVLEKNMDETDRCYSTSFWSPCLVPFYSKYYDYGHGEDDTGVALPYILAGIKDALVETDVGDNKSHDIAVKRDDFDMELFYEAVHESRLFKRNYHGKQQMIEFVMVRKDIADDILANFQREQYVGGGNGDCGWDNNYKIVTFAKILEDLPEFMEKVAEIVLPKADASQEELRLALIELKMMRGLDGVFKYEDTNLVAKWVRGAEDYRMSRLIRPSEIVFGLVAEGKIKEATEFMVDLLKGMYLNCYMEMTRRNWAPAGHEGSQAREAHGYRIMAEATLRAIERERKEHEADSGEEFSEF